MADADGQTLPPADPAAPALHPDVAKDVAAKKQAADDERQKTQTINENMLAYDFNAFGLGYISSAFENSLGRPPVDYLGFRLYGIPTHIYGITSHLGKELFYTDEKYQEACATKGGARLANLVQAKGQFSGIENGYIDASFSSYIRTNQQYAYVTGSFQNYFMEAKGGIGVGVNIPIGPVITRPYASINGGFIPGNYNNTVNWLNFWEPELGVVTKLGGLSMDESTMGRELGIAAAVSIAQPRFNSNAIFDFVELNKQGNTYVTVSLIVQLSGRNPNVFKKFASANQPTSSLPAAMPAQLLGEHTPAEWLRYIMHAPVDPLDQMADAQNVDSNAIHIDDAPEMLHQARIDNMAQMGIVVLETPKIIEPTSMAVNGVEIVGMSRPPVEPVVLTDQYGKPHNNDRPKPAIG